MLKTMRVTTLLAALAAVGTLGACAAATGQQSAGSYADDTWISSKVKAGLVEDQALEGFRVGVETMEGVVQLSGFVDTPAAKSRAEQVARSVDGVKSVRNDIVVRPQSGRS
jgi:osmotically-inducible protein OsmY